MGELLSECCDVEDVERIALGSAERVVSPIAVERMFALPLKGKSRRATPQICHLER
jgi:hypothetical protein